MDVQVLVVGGGIYGAGVLHDLASRGIGGLHLVERDRLASGTSSRSTKLLHGGLRYLEHLAQWGLVREALRERTLLLGLLRAVVRPLPIVLPCVEGVRPPWMVRTGLWLYDRLAGTSNLPRSRRLGPEEVLQLAPYLSAETVKQRFPVTFLYHDAQMKDDGIVRLVAEAARRLGASHSQHLSAEAVVPIRGGFRVDLVGPSGLRQTVTARTVVNAAGPWCAANLLRWGFLPGVQTVLNVGSHLLFQKGLTAAEPDRSAAALYQGQDGRVVFFIPWFGRWLLGTTESVLVGAPDHLKPPARDREYLLRVAEDLLGTSEAEQHVAEAFAGVRTMPLARAGREGRGKLPDAWRERPFESPLYLRRYPGNLSAVSREVVVEETVPGLFTVYGGKFTTYRSRCEGIGDRVSARLDLRARSRTRDAESWSLEDVLAESPSLLESDPSLRCA